MPRVPETTRQAILAVVACGLPRVRLGRIPHSFHNLIAKPPQGRFINGQPPSENKPFGKPPKPDNCLLAALLQCVTEMLLA